MRTLLFGPQGQVGTEILRRAVASGLEVEPVARAACDLSEPARARDIIRARRPAAVINAAAYTAVDRAESEIEAAFAVNATSPGAIAEACAETGAALIHFSTDYVFDGEGVRPYVEDDETRPINVYGASKRAGEEAVLAAGARAAILRLSWVFAGHGSNFVRTMLRRGAERGAVRVVDDQRGRPTPASEAAAAALLALHALAADRAPVGVYHFAGAETATWADLAEAAFRAARMTVDVARIPTSAYPTPARRPRYSVLDTTKFARTFGITAPSWKPGLAAAVDELLRADNRETAP